jgi:two-component sensor histidine kinase
LQVVISLLRLQASKVDDEKVVDMFKNTQKRIFSMALLHESLLQENDLELINANDHFKYLTENLINSYAVDKEINIEIDIENINFGMQTLTPLGLIINEVITNSLKHAFNETKQGEIRIVMRKLHDKKHEIQIADNGSGYIKKSESKGVGTRLVSIFVKQLNGTLELLEHQGTAYRIIFDEIEHT